MIDELIYTSDDVLKELKKIVPKNRTRKRSYLDRRNYLICILHYKFKFTEESIAEHVNITRPTVCLAKKHPIKLLKTEDIVFEINTMHLHKKFPFMIPRTHVQPYRERTKMVFLDSETLNRIQMFKEKYHIDTTRAALRLLINLGLNKIETEPVTFNVIWEQANEIKNI